MYGLKQIPLLHRLPETRIRLFIARILYTFLHLFLRKDEHLINRGGIRYHVDLSEGIDLSLFCFGNYQRHIFDSRYFSLSPDAVIFDVGANIGSQTLSFAKRIPHGRVYAFEPTTYAFSKLLTNIGLNPELAARVTAVRAVVDSTTSAIASDRQIYSSWKVDGTVIDYHPLHGGTAKTAESAPIVSLDDFCRKESIERVDFIKIDTDGGELDVLLGSSWLIEKFHPMVIFEIGLYLLEERGKRVEDYLNFFEPIGYQWINTKNGRPVTRQNFLKELPLRSTTDILAMPPTSHAGS